MDGAKYAKMISDKKLMIFVVVVRAFHSPDCRDIERLNFQFAPGKQHYKLKFFNYFNIIIRNNLFRKL